MNMIRYDPFRELMHHWLFHQNQNFQNQNFDQPYGRGVQGEETKSVGSTWTPLVDVFEDSETITLKFELPEVDANDVDIQIEGNALTLRGERKLERADRQEGYHRIERDEVAPDQGADRLRPRRARSAEAVTLPAAPCALPARTHQGQWNEDTGARAAPLSLFLLDRTPGPIRTASRGWMASAGSTSSVRKPALSGSGRCGDGAAPGRSPSRSRSRPPASRTSARRSPRRRSRPR